MAWEKYHHSLDEAITLLPSPQSKEWLIEQMFNFDNSENSYAGLSIIPSFRSRKKIAYKSNLNDPDEKIKTTEGWFEIHGLNFGEFLSGNNILFKVINDETYLASNMDIPCYPIDEIVIPLSELFIRNDELDHFISHHIDNIDKDIKSHSFKERNDDLNSSYKKIELKLTLIGADINKINEGRNNSKQVKILEEKEEVLKNPVEFAHKYIKDNLEQNKPIEEIVVRLVEDYGSEKMCFYGTIARNFFYKCSRNNKDKDPSMLSNNTLIQQGKRFYEKCKKTLNNRS